MSGGAHAKRREEDLARLQELAVEFAGLVVLQRTAGHPVSLVELELRLRTARSALFPSEGQTPSRVRIELPTRYPFEPPRVTVITPVWNPNVFPSGLVCLGRKWIPTHNLAMLVRRVIQILVLDPAIINLASPANREAAEWYRETIARDPALFPTARLDALRAHPAPRILWRSVR